MVEIGVGKEDQQKEKMPSGKSFMHSGLVRPELANSVHTCFPVKIMEKPLSWAT